MLPTGTCQKGHFNLIFWSGKKNRHLSHFRCVTRNIGHAKHRSFALPTCTCEMSHFDLTFWSAKINCRQSHFRHITQNVTVIHCSQVPASEMTLAEFFGRGKKIVTSHIFSVSHNVAVTSCSQVSATGVTLIYFLHVTQNITHMYL